MAELLQINDYFFDPNRVISVTSPKEGEVLINVDMNEWTASYTVEVEEGGWDLDSIVDAINQGRTST